MEDFPYLLMCDDLWNSTAPELTGHRRELLQDITRREALVIYWLKLEAKYSEVWKPRETKTSLCMSACCVKPTLVDCCKVLYLQANRSHGSRSHEGLIRDWMPPSLRSKHETTDVSLLCLHLWASQIHPSHTSRLHAHHAHVRRNQPHTQFVAFMCRTWARLVAQIPQPREKNCQTLDTRGVVNKIMRRNTLPR